jgi:hypothetical protein
MTEIYAEMSCRGDELMTAAKYDEALAVFTQCSLTGGLSMEDTGSILTKLGYVDQLLSPLFSHLAVL